MKDLARVVSVFLVLALSFACASSQPAGPASQAADHGDDNVDYDEDDPEREE